MMYMCRIESKIGPFLAREKEYINILLPIEADDIADVTAKLMKELSVEKIPNSCLPLSITIEELCDNSEEK